MQHNLAFCSHLGLTSLALCILPQATQCPPQATHPITGEYVVPVIRRMDIDDEIRGLTLDECHTLLLGMLHSEPPSIAIFMDSVLRRRRTNAGTVAACVATDQPPDAAPTDANTDTRHGAVHNDAEVSMYTLTARGAIRDAMSLIEDNQPELEAALNLLKHHHMPATRGPAHALMELNKIRLNSLYPFINEAIRQARICVRNLVIVMCRAYCDHKADATDFLQHLHLAFAPHLNLDHNAHKGLRAELLGAYHKCRDKALYNGTELPSDGFPSTNHMVNARRNNGKGRSRRYKAESDMPATSGSPARDVHAQAQTTQTAEPASGACGPARLYTSDDAMADAIGLPPGLPPPTCRPPATTAAAPPQPPAVEQYTQQPQLLSPLPPSVLEDFHFHAWYQQNLQDLQWYFHQVWLYRKPGP